MIKLENNMLVLDATFSKEDVKLINDFVLQAERRAEDRIIKLLENEKFILLEGIAEGTTLIPIQQAIALIKGEK